LAALEGMERLGSIRFEYIARTEMADPDLSFLQTLIERSLAQQATFSERVERIERVLLHLSRQMEAFTHRVDGLPDLVALQVSEAFERRFSRIEAQMAELDRRTRTSP
jgi:hypothetical protein